MAKKKNRSTAPKPQQASLPRHVLMLALVACDRTFEQASMARADGARLVWQGKCIHCRAALVVDVARPNAGSATIEHIVPQGLGGGHGPENLALACARCNNQKGARLDPLGLDHPRLQAVVHTLQLERAKRLRSPPDRLQLPEAARAWLLGIQPGDKA